MRPLVFPNAWAQSGSRPIAQIHGGRPHDFITAGGTPNTLTACFLLDSAGIPTFLMDWGYFDAQGRHTFTIHVPTGLNGPLSFKAYALDPSGVLDSPTMGAQLLPY